MSKMKSKIIPLLYVQRHVWCMPFEILFLYENNHMKTPFVFIEMRGTSIFFKQFFITLFFHHVLSLSFLSPSKTINKKQINKKYQNKAKSMTHTHHTQTMPGHRAYSVVF